MRILVLGAGVVSVTAAWYLAADGRGNRRRSAARSREVSHANVTDLGVARGALAVPGTAQILGARPRGRACCSSCAPTRTGRRFGLAFLRECLPGVLGATVQCLKLALYSRIVAGAARRTGLACDQRTRHPELHDCGRARRRRQNGRAAARSRLAVTSRPSTSASPSSRLRAMPRAPRGRNRHGGRRVWGCTTFRRGLARLRGAVYLPVEHDDRGARCGR